MIPYLIVAALRLVVPMVIVKKPFWGMVLAILADGAELELIKILGSSFQPAPFVVDYEL